MTRLVHGLHIFHLLELTSLIYQSTHSVSKVPYYLCRDMFRYIFIVLLTHCNQLVIINLTWGQFFSDSKINHKKLYYYRLFVMFIGRFRDNRGKSHSGHPQSLQHTCTLYGNSKGVGSGIQSVYKITNDNVSIFSRSRRVWIYGITGSLWG